MSLTSLYLKLATAAKEDLGSAATAAALREIIAASVAIIGSGTSTPLISKVPGKSYVMVEIGSRKSRPINEAQFAPSMPLTQMFEVIGGMPAPADPAQLDRALYTTAMSYPLAIDLTKDRDKKSPGTFFEILIGHIFAARYGVNPIRTITIPTLDIETSIPTDYIFELDNQRRLHVPIKISTRERVVQVLAHQKLLDGMHGVNRFTGILVCLTETNKQQNTSVVEVCLPNQWVAYQMYIARLERVYYLDPPVKYVSLREIYPHIQVWPFSRFFSEAETIGVRV